MTYFVYNAFQIGKVYQKLLNLPLIPVEHIL